MRINMEKLLPCERRLLEKLMPIFDNDVLSVAGCLSFLRRIEEDVQTVIRYIDDHEDVIPEEIDMLILKLSDMRDDNLKIFLEQIPKGYDMEDYPPDTVFYKPSQQELSEERASGTPRPKRPLIYPEEAWRNYRKKQAQGRKDKL